jgi:hypothetical protein
MNRLTAAMSALVVCSALSAAEQEAKEAGMTDLLGGAAWSERSIAITAGLVNLDVDGTRGGQSATYLAATGQMVSGYAFRENGPTGYLLGIGASVNGWRVSDDIDLWAVAPYAVGIAGIYADVNDRLRAKVAVNAGPGFAYVSGERDSDVGFGYTYGIEATLSLSKGENRGLGVGIGYSVIELEEFSQEGVYISVTIGF